MLRLTFGENGFAFSDLLIMKADSEEVLFASLVGFRRQVWSVANAFNRARGQHHIHMTSAGDEVWDPAFRDGRKIEGRERKYQIFSAGRRKGNSRQSSDPEHLIVVHKDVIAGNLFLLLNADRNMEPIPEEQAFWREWQRRLGGLVPGLPEWAPWVWSQVKAAHATRLRVYQRPGRGLTAYLLDLDAAKLRAVVSRGLRTKRLAIPDGYDTGGLTLDGVRNVSDYLQRFAEPLSRRVKEMYTPRYLPGESVRDPLLDDIGSPRARLLTSQEAVAQGAASALRELGAVLLCADMGTGKTAMAIAITHLVDRGKPARWAVLCPPHLVGTWESEIRKWMPTAEVFTVERISDLEALVRSRPWKPERMEFVLISRERAKLGSPYRPAVLYGYRPVPTALTRLHRSRADMVYGPICPVCGLVQVKNGQRKDEVVPWPEDFFQSRRTDNACCVHCGSPLWTVGRSAQLSGRMLRRPEGWTEEGQQVLHRYPIAEYVKRRLKGWCRGMIADEVHEFKGDTAQHAAFAAMAASVHYLVCLTGTLTGGYALDVFRVLLRLDPRAMNAAGFQYHLGGQSRFVSTYGRVERVRKVFTPKDEYLNVSSKGRKSQTTIRQLPFISPRLFGDFLMDRAGFLRIEDIGADLPPYSERVELVDPEPDLAERYADLERELSSLVAWGLRNGDKRGVGVLVSYLRQWPDRPWNWEPIRNRETGAVILESPELPKRHDRRKVARLAELCLEQKRAGRRCIVLADATDKHDVQPWVREVLSSRGLNSVIMYARDVPPNERLDWLRVQALRGVDVVICHPRLIETGLTLLDYPTILWFQVGYSLFTLRQASRRSWRIGQTQPVEVVFLAYRHTIQERALQLMGAKLEAALGIEGRLNSDGLRALAGDTDIVLALAKSLVEGIDSMASAEAVWARVAAKERAAGSYRTLADLSDAERERLSGMRVSVAPAAETEPERIALGLVDVRRGKRGVGKQLTFLF